MTERIKIDLELISGALVYLCEIIDLEYAWSNDFEITKKIKAITESEVIE